MNNTETNSDSQNNWMTGILSIVFKMRSYLDSPSEELPPDTDTIDLIYNQVDEWLMVQKEDNLSTEQVINDCEQILRELEALKGLLKAEQSDLEMISDVAIKLMRATWRISAQLLDGVSPELKDRILEEKAEQSDLEMISDVMIMLMQAAWHIPVQLPGNLSSEHKEDTESTSDE